MGVQVKLLDPLRTRALPERFYGGDSLRRGAVSDLLTLFTVTFRNDQQIFSNEIFPPHFNYDAVSTKKFLIHFLQKVQSM